MSLNSKPLTVRPGKIGNRYKPPQIQVSLQQNHIDKNKLHREIKAYIDSEFHNMKQEIVLEIQRQIRIFKEYMIEKGMIVKEFDERVCMYYS